jgi:simple sugar transport system substrate-binding protein
MITQFSEAVATQPDGIAVMGHPGDEAFGPLVDEAVAQGIIVTVMNTELADTQAAHAAAGTGYVGAVLHKAGSDLAKEAVARAGLTAGDQVFVWGLVSQAGRGERTQGILDGLVESGIAEEDIVYLEIDDATNSDPAAGIPTFTGMASSNPDLKAAFFDHGNVTSAAQSYLEAAGLGPDDIYVAGFDLSPATVAAVQSGYTDLVIDQQQWLQGFEAIAQICLTHNYGFSGLNINTGGGFADASNIELLAPLVEQQIR